MGLFGTGKEIFDFFGNAVKVGIVFEVVDDPADNSPYVGYIKPVDVWIAALKKELSKQQATPALIRERGECVRNITKNTSPERRAFSFSTVEEGFFYVAAFPVPEWEQYYTVRTYAPIRIVTGKRFNFAVSLPPAQP